LHDAINRYTEAHADKHSARQDRIRGATLKRLLPNGSAYRLDTGGLARYTTARKSEGIAPATINRELALLSTVLNDAIKQGFSVPNPVRGHKQREPEGRQDFLHPDEAARLIQAAQDSRTPFLADWIILSLYTGLRFGELCALTWADVREDTLTVRAAAAKSKKSRTLKLIPTMVALIERQPHRGATVFTTPHGEPVKDVRAALTHACERAGLRRITPHLFRHTCASWLVQQGVDLYVVKEWLGHSTITVTERYAHLAPTHLQACSTALESQFSPTGKLVPPKTAS
jgi:integrase